MTSGHSVTCSPIRTIARPQPSCRQALFSGSWRCLTGRLLAQPARCSRSCSLADPVAPQVCHQSRTVAREQKIESLFRNAFHARQGKLRFRQPSSQTRGKPYHGYGRKQSSEYADHRPMLCDLGFFLSIRHFGATLLLTRDLTSARRMRPIYHGRRDGSTRHCVGLCLGFRVDVTGFSEMRTREGPLSPTCLLNPAVLGER